MKNSYEVRFKETTFNQIEDAYDWYEMKREGLGRLFLFSIDDVVLLLKNNPYQFMKIYKEVRRAVTKKFPYALFYRIKEDEYLVEILAVRHQAQDPDYVQNV
ncbi:MAG: type II toxin-antitoxin system RelE/ParE family toxin [Okeania sp. SIO3C4]|nr:type II toxin-antitoxin system RelE/ParE family toxin [Okeania sp. SIO3C4]